MLLERLICCSPRFTVGFDAVEWERLQNKLVGT
jgi:hypothetical protein